MISGRVLSVDVRSPAPKILDHAATVLAQGGLIVAPTETRYGILANALDRKSLDRLYLVKGRPKNMPTALFVGSIDDITQASRVTSAGKRIINRFLPGPVTVVLEARGVWEPQVVVDGKLGFRYSPSLVISGILARCGFPLTATSANRSGGQEFNEAAEIEGLFGETVDLYLDGGPLTGLPSTVVDCSGAQVRILREGAVPSDVLLESVKDLNTP